MNFDFGMGDGSDDSTRAADPSTGTDSDGVPVTGTGAPTDEVTLTEIVNPCPGPDCNELAQSIVSIPLEVETAPGTDAFTKEVAASLSTALAEIYQTSEIFERRRRHRRRMQDTALFLRGVTIVDEEGKLRTYQQQDERFSHSRVLLPGFCRNMHNLA